MERYTGHAIMSGNTQITFEQIKIEICDYSMSTYSKKSMRYHMTFALLRP